MNIGNRTIGPNEPPFIIAEVGSCWDSWEHCKDAINIAKNCGADAVKFQLFKYDELYGVKERVKPLGSDHLFPIEVSSGQSPYLHHGWLEGLKQKADAAGIELMCSAFSVEGLEFVDKYVNVHKLASSENNHLRMLEKLRELGKPVFMSTGGSTIGDIVASVRTLQKDDHNFPVVPMYCVSDYPAKRINLAHIAKLKNTNYPIQIDPEEKTMLPLGLVGYSDHSTDVVELPKAAVKRGAVVIEKHVNFFNVDCPDSPHSLNTDDFKAFCDAVKGRPVSDAGQSEMYTKHNRRLIAIKDIEPGDTLQEGVNFGIFRSLKEDTAALSPFKIDQVKGKVSKVSLKAGDGVKMGDA